jgi:hypothetical protein
MERQADEACLFSYSEKILQNQQFIEKTIILKMKARPSSCMMD